MPDRQRQVDVFLGRIEGRELEADERFPILDPGLPHADAVAAGIGDFQCLAAQLRAVNDAEGAQRIAADVVGYLSLARAQQRFLPRRRRRRGEEGHQHQAAEDQGYSSHNCLRTHHEILPLCSGLSVS